MPEFSTEMPTTLFGVGIRQLQILIAAGVDPAVAIKAVAVLKDYEAAEIERRRTYERERKREYRERAKPVPRTAPDALPTVPPSKEIIKKIAREGISEDWVPGPEDAAAAKAVGLAEAEIGPAVVEFRDHWLARSAEGIVDFGPIWRGWCRNRVAILANRPAWRGGGALKPRPTPAEAVFIAAGTPQWRAHEAVAGKPLDVRTYRNGTGGRYFRSEWPLAA